MIGQGDRLALCRWVYPGITVSWCFSARVTRVSMRVESSFSISAISSFR